jgi:intein/homing endonuclease
VSNAGAAAAALLGAIGGSSVSGPGVFDEEPVPLSVFVRDRAYLANPPLSEVQYEAVRHAERVYYPATYELLAGSADREVRNYWSAPCRMVNSLELEWGKGCKIAGMEFYDAVTGRWETVEAAAAPGVIAAMRPGSTPEYAIRSSFFKAGSGQCLEVVTKSGYKTTVHQHHQFLTRGDGKVPFWRCLTQMRQGDWIATTRSLPEPLQPTVLDSREVELVGLWLGDGNMPRLRRRGKYEFWTKLRMTIGHDAAVELARYEVLCCSYGAALKVRDTNKLSVETRFGKTGRNDPVTEIARKWGLFGKTFRDKRVPPEMMGLRRDLAALLLSRLIDTDGSVYFEKTGRPRIEFASVSEGLVLDVRRLMLRLGARATVRQRVTRCQQPNCEGHTSWRLVVTDDQSLASLAAELTLLDKQGRLEEVRGWVRHWQVERGTLREPLYWDRIETIRDAGVHEFYDTEVTDSSPGPVWPSEAVQIEPESPGMHNYLSTGFLDHNGGKDHTCRMIAMRVCYLLLCLKSPQLYYAMPEQDSIHVLNVASSSRQAQRAFFAPMRRAVQRPGGWFQRAGIDILDAAERQRRGAKGERTTTLLDTIRFEHNIEAVSGHSDADSQEGLNLILGIADEIDAFRSAAELARNASAKQRESSSSAEAIIAMLRTSAVTRFPEVYKNVHISYPRYLGSTIQQLVAKGKADNEAKGEDSRYYVSGPLATWEANPRIPGKEAFAEDYERDPALAESKFECKPRRAVNPYFANEAAVRECFYEVTQPPVSVAYVREGATWKPLYTFAPDFFPVKGALYAMHADLAATGDRAGVTMAHVRRWQDHTLVGNDEDGLEIKVSERRPVVKVDFTISYESDAGAVPPMEIQIRWARMLCLELRRMGFPVTFFSFDQWQSKDSMQILESHGIETDRFSTDVSEEGWRTLRDVMYEGRLEAPMRELTVVELLGLSRLPNGKIDHLGDSCFVGSTRVPLLDGRDVQIQDLADGEPVWVYSSDDQGRIVPALAIGRKTRLTRQLCDVVLNTGATVRCTPEHLWRLRDGSYKEAQALQPKDRLMPILRKYDTNSGYEKVTDRDSRLSWTHVLVRTYLDGQPLGREEVSHHDNEVKTDNRPENLIRMDRVAHLAHHTTKRHAEDSGYRQTLRAAQQAYWSSPEAREQQAEVARQSNRRRSNIRVYHAARMELLRSVISARSVGAAAKQVGLSRNSALTVLRLHGFGGWADFKARDGLNHRVKFTELVELDEPVWVYDLEVDGFHNFALTAGVFVHNSKDEADSLAGAVVGALAQGGQEDPNGKRAYPGQLSFFGPVSEMPVPAGMPSSLAVLGPDQFMPADRPGMEYGVSFLDDWGGTDGDYMQ